MPLLTLPHYAAPSQALPDHFQQDHLKYSPRSASRTNVHDDDDGWANTLRPIVLDPPTSRSASHSPISHSRESSLEKLQSGGLAGIPESPLTTASPRTHASSLRTGIGAILERAVDPKAAAYGHHRQTSIVHGIQHSRNGSRASSSSSPLSPQMIAAAGVGLLPERPDLHAIGRTDSDMSVASRPPTAMSGTTVGSNVHPSLQRTLSTSETSGGTLTQRKHSKNRRDHSQHPSHSSRHHSEQKTVGEYALHVLFTHVSIGIRSFELHC
jgi:hypothetical protein